MGKVEAIGGRVTANYVISTISEQIRDATGTTGLVAVVKVENGDFDFYVSENTSNADVAWAIQLLQGHLTKQILGVEP